MFKIGDFELIKENSMEVGFLILDDSIVVNYGGKPHLIASDDGRYKEVLECIREGKLENLPNIVDIEKRFSGEGIELKDGLFVANGEQLPVELQDRIIKFKDAKLPYTSLIKFWGNLKKNPSYNARQMLFKFLEHNGICLTSDGCFIAYRGVTEDFKDKHTGKFDNRPGSVCEMPRNEVDDNPNNTCSNGLHVACFEYAKGFGPKLVEVKVNPVDVVCVPTDYDGTKMRTCKFEVIREGENIKETLLEEVDDLDHNFGDLGSVTEEYEFMAKAIPAMIAVKTNYRHGVRDKNGRFKSKKRKVKSKKAKASK